MFFANPWGLLGLLTIPLIAFIHLYQRRFPPLDIAGLHLWGVQEQTKTAGTRRDRLPITRTLLLELLAALLLTLLLARPQLANLESATHWIVVLDNSASMSAEPGQGQSFRSQAIEKVRERVTGSGRNSRVSIIVSGIRPAMLVGPAATWSEAKQALESWSPQDTQHDFQPAWQMASQLAEGQGELVFVTDRSDTEEYRPATFEIVSVGEALSNLAFETARWSIDPDTLQQNLYLRVRNHSETALEADVVGIANDAEIFRTSLSIDARSGKPLTTQLPGGLRSLTIRIDSIADRLKTDSEMELVEPKICPVSIAISLPPDHPARKRLLRVTQNLPGVKIVDQAEADFYVSLISNPPDPAVPGWWLALGPLNDSKESKDNSRATSGPFLIERRNALLEGLNLQGVIWAGVQENNVPLQPMISVGPQVLFGKRADLSSPSFVMNIDLETSNVTDSPDWPILISNLIVACRTDLPGLRRWNYQVNEIIRFKLVAEPDIDTSQRPLVLKHKTRERPLVRTTTIETPALTTTGIFEVVDGERVLDRFAVNFYDSQESDLTGLAAGEIKPTILSSEKMELSETTPWVWMLIVAAVMVVVFLNWGGLKPKNDRHIDRFFGERWAMIRFDFPEVFLLAIPLYFAWQRWARVRGTTGWLRAVIVLLLLSALAIPRLDLAGDGMDIIVVVDRSRSMPEDSDQNTRDLINDLESNRRPGDRISVVAFGSHAAIERELSESAIFNEFTKVVDTHGSDLNEALLKALDRRTHRNRPARIVLMSDGLYNGPSPLYAARRAREEQIPIDVRSFEKPLGGDLAIESILLPRETAPHEPFQFSVMVFADRDAEGTVVVYRDGAEIARRSESLVLGLNRLVFRDWVQEGGVHQYSAELVADSNDLDPIQENNRASSLIRVVTSPKILLVTPDGQKGNIGLALEAGRIPFDVVDATSHSMTPDALDGYRGVILENIAANDLGRVRMERLAQFVEDLGGGLLMTGGKQSFGSGGYYKSPLEDVLPVALHSLEDTHKTRAAIAVVLDRSGSMMAPVHGGKTKMDLANLGTAECVRMLSNQDMVAVIAVDSSDHLIQPIVNVTDPSAINSRVLRIQSMGGGIYVHTGLVAAGRELMKAEGYATRHIILFSDAADSEEPGNYQALLGKYAAAGITVSVIGLGSKRDPDAQLLIDIAKRGNGTCAFSTDPLDLPRLFTQDTMNVTRNMFLTKESEEAPLGFSGSVVPGIQLLGAMPTNSFPSVDGYNLTFLKSDATQGIISVDENQAPFSAFWYRGLGRVVAIPLELDGEFSGQMGTWTGYEDFVISHARWILGEKGTPDVYVSLVQDGLDAVVQVELDPNRPNKQRGITPQLVILPPSAERSQVIEPQFVWTGPDTLEGRFRLDKQGSYHTLVKLPDRQFARGPILTLPYSPEFMPRVGVPGGPETLASIVDLTEGKMRVNVLEMYDDFPPQSRQYRSLVPYLCLASIVFLVVEIVGRRWGWWERWASYRANRRKHTATSKVAVTPDPQLDGFWTTTRSWFSRKRPPKRAGNSSAAPAARSETKPKQAEPSAPEPAQSSPAPADIYARAKRRAKDRLK